MAAPNVKLKILCLHGYRQSGQAFRERTGALRKSLKKYAEFYFCDAPHQVCAEQSGESSGPCLGWWFSREDNYYKAVENSDIAKGYHESIDAIAKVFKENGPFDGVLAFSQGASFLALLCALKERKTLDLDFQFVMLFAGFKSRCSPHGDLYSTENPIKIPALLCIGETDEVIPLEMSKDLIQYFNSPTVVFHSGGHFIPNQPEQRKAYIEFLNKVIELKSTSK